MCLKFARNIFLAASVFVAFLINLNESVELVDSYELNESKDSSNKLNSIENQNKIDLMKQYLSSVFSEGLDWNLHDSKMAHLPNSASDNDQDQKDKRVKKLLSKFVILSSQLNLFFFF